ncbi:extracellular solute-binding protein [Paenibacillus sp. GYB004]|uniref:extracellular solute-binding protein n=1 Tax=Paenibacillus sp. GYB004 TaxID=2994393 RepID=UPI002F96B464
MNEKPSRKTFHARLEKLVDEIRSDIVQGVLREGEFLPSEKAYAKQHRLSNKSVRQGLEVLVAERLIEKIPRVGNKVARYARSETVVLKFACHTSLPKEAAMKTLVAEFHKRHPGIRVEFVTYSGAINTFRTVKQLIEEEAVDVFTMNYNGYDDFKRNGGLDYLETLEPNPNIYPFLTDVMTTNDGQLKGQPFLFTPLILCYNKDHFREKGVLEPDSGWRWDVLFEQASKLAVENERLGFYFHFPSSNRWPVFLLQSGIRFDRDERNRFSIGGTQLLDSLRACRKLIHMQKGFPLFLSEKDADAEDLFFRGKVSMIMTTYLSLNHHERPEGLEYDVAPLPYLNDPKTLLMTIGLAVNASSKVKDSAKLFVDFLVSYEAQLMIRQKTLSIPSLKPAAEWTGKESMYRPSRFHMYRDIIPAFRTFGTLNMSIKELDAVYGEAKLYWSGLETEEGVAARLEQLLDRLGGSGSGHGEAGAANLPV